MSWAMRIVPLAALPLFISLPNGDIPFMHLFGYSIVRDSISLNLNILQCLMGIVFFFSRPLDRKLSYFLFFSVIWLMASLLAGFMQEFSVTNVAFYVQTILPLFTIAYGYQLIQSEKDLDQFIRVSTHTTAWFLVALTAIVMSRYGLASLLSDRMGVMRELEFAIPQFKSYYAVAVQFTFSLALAQYLFGRSANSRSVFLTLTAHALFVPFCWSRAGLLGIALSAVIQFVIAASLGKLSYCRRVAGIIVAFALVLPFLFTQMGSTVSSRTDVVEIDNASDTLRLELFIEGALRVYDQPIFGDMFVPCWDERIGGMEIDVKRLFGAHNQYVDYALRGGVLYLVVIAIIIIATYNKARFLTRIQMSEQHPEYLVIGAASCSYLLATVVSSNFQLYLIQLQTAVPFFLMMGVTYRTWRLATAKLRATRSSGSLPLPTNLPRTPHRLLQPAGYGRAQGLTVSG